MNWLRRWCNAVEYFFCAHFGYQLSIVQALQYYRILLLISVPGFLYSILLFAQVTNPKVDLRCIHRYVDVRQKALKHRKKCLY